MPWDKEIPMPPSHGPQAQTSKKPFALPVTPQKTLMKQGPDVSTYSTNNQLEKLPASGATNESPSKRVCYRELKALTQDSFANSNGKDPNAPSDLSRDDNIDNWSCPVPGQKPLPNFRPETTPRHQRALRRNFLRSTFYTPDVKEDGGAAANIDFNMSGQQGKWREDQILIICPGSHTTLAQLGCQELTPPAHRIPTRMFQDPEGDGFLPYRTYKRKKGGSENSSEADATKMEDEEYEYVEDRDSVEGAIYPMVAGRIKNMAAFLAFLDHVHSLLTTTYHNTPIMLMASPQWTRPDLESIARYIFEKTKTPALCLIHSAVASQYGLKWPSMTVVDIGYEKVDVTCIYDYNIVNQSTLGFPNPYREIAGGEIFTQRLLKLLEDKGFSYDMAEKLKKSPICEVLPYAADLEKLMDLPSEGGPAASQPMVVEPVKIDELPKPVPPVGTEEENGTTDEVVTEDGVLDVASIVTTGNAREFLAKKEKEKAEKAKSKKGKGQEAEPAGAKPTRLPNSKRKFNTFHYDEWIHEDVEVPVSNGVVKPETAKPPNGDLVSSAPKVEPTATAEAISEAPAETPAVAPAEAPAEASAEASAETTTAPPTEEVAKPAAGEGDVVMAPPAPAEINAELPFTSEVAETVTERRTKLVRKDIEVGLERFLFADRLEVDRITTTIYRTIQGIYDMYKRPACWDNIVFVGNGSRLRGLKENILQTLISRHLISPSSATIFTSELPSNMATPTGTGSQTPTGSFTGQLPTTSSVNPLLQAATTASLGVPGAIQAPGSNAGDAGPSHQFHSQTPTSIKTAALPTYLAEWTKNGFEESMFLGSLIAARLAFCIHNLDASTTEAQRGMSLTRVDYNELGPKGVRTHSMIG
ncbi:hypothetical protein BX600DRAFT_520700 [Xylariales sp. PMI_506]|nr:hypothetical protein BX600DRAFT_520700 [Xylariales sp. PMI_506]